MIDFTIKEVTTTIEVPDFSEVISEAGKIINHDNVINEALDTVYEVKVTNIKEQLVAYFKQLFININPKNLNLNKVKLDKSYNFYGNKNNGFIVINYYNDRVSVNICCNHFLYHSCICFYYYFESDDFRVKEDDNYKDVGLYEFITRNWTFMKTFLNKSLNSYFKESVNFYKDKIEENKNCIFALDNFSI